MRRNQLEHAIRTAGQIIGHEAVVVVGSQAILGSFAEDELPVGATMSLEIQNPNTAAPSGQPQYTGWCLDKDDLCVAKLCALREKDRNFVAALLDAGLIDAGVIAKRLREVPQKHHPSAEHALALLASRG